MARTATISQDPFLTKKAQPRIRRTRSGIEFDSAGDRWSYVDGVTRVSLDFTALTGFSSAMIWSAKETLAWYAENYTPGYLINIFYRLRHLAQSLHKESEVINSIRATDLLNYLAELSESQKWYLGVLSAPFKKWAQLGYEGIDPDALILLKQLRLKGCAKGVAVMTMDPEKGPFTPIETESLQTAINQAYGAGDIDLGDYVLAWLYLLLGQRNTQYATLKICDVRCATDDNGLPIYSIMIPSAKRRGIFSRDRLVERRLLEQFGEMVLAYAEELRGRFQGLLPDPGQAPLFPRRLDIPISRIDPPGFEYHQIANDLLEHMQGIFGRLHVMSERTGKPINISGHRFRRTVGTRAAEEGHSPLVIAALLDHTDTQNVGVYTASSPAIIERIDRAIAMQMAPLAQAFAGVLVDRAGTDTGSATRIVDLRIDRSGAAMGQCGKHGFCGFAAPIACYTCNNFEAWPDGPHEAVLSHLLERRERLMATSDKRMASINDRTILAVAEVVKRCAELKKNHAKAIDG